MRDAHYEHQESPNRSKRKVLIIVGVVVVVILAVAAVVLAVTLSKSSSTSTSTTNDSPTTTDAPAPVFIPPPPLPGTPGPSTDPTEEKYVINLFAIGDWGSTTNKVGGSCCSQYRKNAVDSPAYLKDYWSQKNLAHLLGIAAGQLDSKPVAILGHGDNIYWNGIGPADVDTRFDITFETMYNQKELEGIPWINVAGNHDIGGSAYICGDSDDKFRACKDTAEMLKYLNLKFDLQAQYKSPNMDRWKLTDHYYKWSVNTSGISVDVFNVDTNFADSHGAQEVCCQCYGYSNGGKDHDCKNINRGDAYCAGGNTDMYDACFKEIQGWWDDSIAQLTKDATASKADYKFVNTHFSPLYHMSPPKADLWMNLLDNLNITLFLNGHTHGESHDFATKWGGHFITNGAGGGIQSQSASISTLSDVESVWTAKNYDYGYFEISVSKEWLKIQFVTFDDYWVFSTDFSATVFGGKKVEHCWYIPQKGGGGGQSCMPSQVA